MDKKKYIQTVTEQIRCKRALPLVTKELEGHIEDQKSDYMKAGMNAEEAEEAAVLEMGDPVEVGVEMDRIHRPKMAWKMIGLIAILNLAGIVLMYLIRTSILADAGNNPGDVEWIASGIGDNINYLKTFAVNVIVFCQHRPDRLFQGFIDLPQVRVQGVSPRCRIRHIKDIVQARVSAGFIQQRNALGTTPDVTVHAPADKITVSLPIAILAVCRTENFCISSPD